MLSFLQRLKDEPVLVTSAIRAACVLGAGFGLHLTLEQIGAVVVLVEVAFALFTRNQVTPAAKAEDMVIAAATDAAHSAIPVLDTAGANRVADKVIAQVLAR